jgi:hypothetical protein
VLLAAALLGCASRHGFQTKEEADHFMVSAIIRADPTPEHMASFRVRSSFKHEEVAGRQFLVVVADLNTGKYRSIRGMGGNGPFFVFLIRGQQMFLAYRNQFDEKVNRVVLHEGDNGSVMLHTYAHIGLSSGPQKPTVHEMRRGKLAFEYRGIGN